MIPALYQRALAGGEIAPALAARADNVKVQYGLATCRNAFVMRHGGVTNRPGTKLVGETKDSTKLSRVIRFRFNTDQTYCLEVGEGYIRFASGGARIMAASDGAPDVYDSGTSYVHGDVVTYFSRAYFCKEAVTPADSGHAPDPGGSTDFWHQMSAAPSIFEVPTPYLEAELFELQVTQTGDVLTFVHRNHPIHQLTRLGLTYWTFRPLNVGPSINGPAGLAATTGGGTGNTYRYKVTAVKKGPIPEESFVGRVAATALGLVTTPTPEDDIELRTVAHGLAVGDEVLITAITHTNDIADNAVAWAFFVGKVFRISAVSADYFVLEDSKGGYGPTGGPGASMTWARTHVELANVGVPSSTANQHTITWTIQADAIEYYVYKELNGVYSYIGTAKGGSFKDRGEEPDTEETPPLYKMPFTVGKYPGATGFYQQRQAFGASDDEPRRVHLSRAGNFRDFSQSSPLVDDDAIAFDIDGQEVNQVRALLNLGQLVILTQGVEWLARGDGDGVIRATQPPNLEPQSYVGAASLRPIVVGNTALYVQELGSGVQDLRYDVAAQGVAGGYTGRDLTIFASHLFAGRQIVDWDFAQTPDSIVFACRDDGVLLGLTYLADHDVWGWHRHDTAADGKFESFAAVPEEGEHAGYMIVRRTIDGATKRFWERFTARKADHADYDLARDAFFVDCGLTYDGTNDTEAHVLQLQPEAPSGPDQGWGAGTEHLLTSSDGGGGGLFSAGDVGHGFRITGSDGQSVDVVVIAYSSATLVHVVLVGAAPTSTQDEVLSTWLELVDEVSGMGHLEGEVVSVLADGVERPVSVVDGGSVLLYGGLQVFEFGAGQSILRQAVNVAVGVQHAMSVYAKVVDGGGPVVLSINTDGSSSTVTVPDDGATHRMSLVAVGGASNVFDIETNLGGARRIALGWAQLEVGSTVTSYEHCPTQDYGARNLLGQTGRLDGGLWSLGGSSPPTLVAAAVADPAGLLAVAGIAHVGLGYETDVETLDLDVAAATDSPADRPKMTPSAVLLVDRSRGFKVGGSFEANRMAEFRPDQPLGAAALYTGKARVYVDARWNDQGRIYIRQSKPLPFTLLGIMPRVAVGGRT